MLTYRALEVNSEAVACDVAAFLNQKGRAQGVWMHMMEAGERYIKSSLKATPVALQDVKQTASRTNLV